MEPRVNFDHIMHVVSEYYGVAESDLMCSPRTEQGRKAQAMAVLMSHHFIDMTPYAMMSAYQISRIRDVRERIQEISENIRVNPAAKREFLALIMDIRDDAEREAEELESNPVEAARQTRMRELGDQLEAVIGGSEDDGFNQEQFDAILAELEELEPMRPITEEETEESLRKFWRKMDRQGKIDYKRFYEFVVAEEQELEDRGVQKDYQLCKALAACYELREYLENRIEELELRKDIE